MATRPPDKRHAQHSRAPADNKDHHCDQKASEAQVGENHANKNAVADQSDQRHRAFFIDGDVIDGWSAQSKRRHASQRDWVFGIKWWRRQ